MSTFLIHPADLERRRKRCRGEAEGLLRLERHTVASCNVCSSPRHALIAAKDRYGLPLRMALCLDCGLFYLVDRFSAAAYSDFYSTGAYRAVSCQFNGVEHTIGHVQSDQLSYAHNLVRMLSGNVPLHGSGRRAGKLLDVGGSAGIVAREVAGAFGLSAMVLDPATDEVEAARAAGVDAVVGSLEDWNTSERFDLILLCRSIEHLFDLRRSLTRIRALLNPGGVFYCDIVDFMEMCRMVGSPQTFVKVDHCYWLTQSSAPSIFRSLGFEVISVHIAGGFGYAGFILRPCEPVAAPSAEPRVLAQVEELQKIDRDWRSFGATSLGAGDWFHRKAYRAKRKLTKLLVPRAAKQAAEPAGAAPMPIQSASKNS